MIVICPLSDFLGLGYGQMFATVMVLIYYCSLMAITSFYFVQSFAAELPWSTCAEEWDMCFDSKPGANNESKVGNLTGLKSSSELYF
jgi:solute carrier family 6 amino acid transporter-like protein 5/7/9/14